MVVKSYRGLLEDGGQEKIRLTSTDGRTGYKIIKFRVMNPQAGASAYEMESTVKIYKTEQTIVDAMVNFSEGVLLGAAQLGTHASFGTYPQSTIIIFDSEIFNQDIFVTHKNLHSDALECNYYIELEQIKLSPAEAEVLIVKDLRKQPWTRP